MTEPIDLKDRLERLAQFGDYAGPESLLATIRTARNEPGAAVTPVGASRRRALVSVLVAFVAVVAIAVGAVTFVTRNRTSAPPASSPTPPVPVGITNGSVTAGPSQPALVSRSEGWVCDQPLRHTVDGGKTWQSIRVPLLQDFACEFLPDGRAWLWSGGNIVDERPMIIRLVVEGHPDFTSVQLPSTTPQTQLSAPMFIDENRGWAVTSLQLDQAHAYRSRYALYSTVDGGRHWKLVLARAPISGALEFTGATHGWAAAGDVLARTDDGGRTWTRVPVPLPATTSSAVPTLESVSVFGDRIVVVGRAGRPGVRLVTSHGFVDVSNDGGHTWSLRTLPESLIFVRQSATNFVVVDASHWRVWQYEFWITDDAGDRWQHIGNPLMTVLAPGNNGGVSFVTRDLGWVTICKPVTIETLPVGNPPCHPFVVRTTDGGRTWTRLAQL